jgi:hypothetical protein
MQAVDLDSLLPPSGTQYLELNDELDGSLLGFGERFAKLLLPRIQAVGGGGALASIAYNDRYLQTPLTARLLTEAVKGLRDAMSGGEPLPIHIVTNPLRENERQPFAPDHDWQFGQDRDDVLIGLLEQAGFAVTLDDHDAAHGRAMALRFVSGKSVRIILDQGFGPWRAPRVARFDFGAAALKQLEKLSQFNALIAAKSLGYVVVTA